MWRRLWKNFESRVKRGKNIKGGVVVKKEEVKKSLLEQLRLQNKSGQFYQDLVNDYMEYWTLKKKLIADVKKKGIRYETVNGNGITVEKANESIQNLQKTTVTMLKILNDLNLKEPLLDHTSEDDYL